MNGEFLEVGASFLVALVASAGIVFPFFSETKGLQFFTESDESQSRLAVRREQVLHSIEALELDFRAGKVDDSYYKETRENLVREVIACTEKLEDPENSNT